MVEKLHLIMTNLLCNNVQSIIVVLANINRSLIAFISKTELASVFQCDISYITFELLFYPMIIVINMKNVKS